jgi:hypothetical protein
MCAHHAARAGRRRVRALSRSPSQSIIRARFEQNSIDCSRFEE